MPFAMTTGMFRITKAFENRSTFIFRIEGKVTDTTLPAWIAEINSFKQLEGRQVILDFCDLLSICPAALEALLKNITDDLFILNCGVEIRNLLHASGLAGRMLE